jgi:hypothetical protein
MKRFLIIPSLILIALLPTTFPVTAQKTKPTSCEPFRVAGPISRVLTEHPTRRIGLFNLETVDDNFQLPEPKTQYNSLIRVGTWVVVVACTCDNQDTYVLSMRRGRKLTGKDELPYPAPKCPVAR